MDTNNSLTTPQITVGMPVYNEEAFVGAAIESLLAQTFTDFRLIIADNCSTDGTAQICEEYARRDGRVSFHRHAENLGSLANFQHVLEFADTPYFMWAGSHDLWAPNYLERLRMVLETNPDAVLAYGPTRVIDGFGNTTIERISHEPSYVQHSPIKRACNVVLTLGLCNMFYGMHRTRVIQSSRLDVRSVGCDQVILMELALRGKIIFDDGTEFIRREYRPQPESADAAQLRRVLGKDDVSEALARRCVTLFREYRKSCVHACDNVVEKFLVTSHVSIAFLRRRSGQLEASWERHCYWAARIPVRILRLPHRIIRRLAKFRKDPVTDFRTGN